jgi:ribosomal protein S18 acetylase RimI-like enzyme
MTRGLGRETAARLPLDQGRAGKRAPAGRRRAPAMREATLKDVPALVAIENRCFATDRLSARSFRHLLTKGNAAVIVAERGGAVRGCAVVLFQRGTSLARLYSIAVAPGWRGRGIGRALVAAAERAAVMGDAAYLRLEVRSDNRAARAMYRKRGYRQFAVQPDYYEDHADAVRLQKTLVPRLTPARARVPFYAQTLDITCGSACLMMAMKALDPKMALDRKLELRLWRESTTIFMTSGHGGCGPLGLALSAWRRGFDVELHVSGRADLFVDSVRSEEKREVIRLAHEDILEEVEKTGIQLRFKPLPVRALRQKFEADGIPVVLISSYRLSREKAPHWVVVAGFDDRFVYIHDPYVDEAGHETVIDCAGIPLLPEEFERMTVYGRKKLYAILVLRRRRS